jgi:hypothetical protein
MKVKYLSLKSKRCVRISPIRLCCLQSLSPSNVREKTLSKALINVLSESSANKVAN